jgi:transcription antitermination protein NusB
MAMQVRRIARELALLSLSQLPSKPDRLKTQTLQDIVTAAVRTLAAEVRDALETASGELQRSDSLLLDSETRASSPEAAAKMLRDAVKNTENAINRLGLTLEIPEFIQMTNQNEVRNYALEIVGRYQQEKKEVNERLDKALVDWQLSRLAGIDRDILRIAAVEFIYLGVPDRVVVNEAVELAKRYSGEDGHRFINGVLRRFLEQASGKSLPTEEPDSEIDPEIDPQG